jgi:hypothetical protein
MAALPFCSRHNPNLTFAGIQKPGRWRQGLLFVALRVVLRALGDPTPRNFDRVTVLLVDGGWETSVCEYNKISH